jgi:hypothetical protein
MNSIEKAIDLVKDLRLMLQMHDRLTCEQTKRISDAIEQTVKALDNVCHVINNHEKRIKQLETK